MPEFKFTLSSWITCILSALGCLLLTSCIHTASPNLNRVDTTNLAELVNLQAPDSDSIKSEKNKGIRYMGIQETALSVGAQGGLANRSRAINHMLNRNTANLTRSFNFRGLLLNHNVVPPVLIESDNTLNLDNAETIRIASKTYKIEKQAHFVTAVPTWRDYLWMDFTRPAVPDPSLLPKNDEEDKIWKKYVIIGWRNGVEQANNIYSENLARMKRDYEGMVRYRELLTKGIINAPFVAKTDLGITGDSNNISINDRVLRITNLPRLNTDAEHWKPVVQQ